MRATATGELLVPMAVRLIAAVERDPAGRTLEYAEARVLLGALRLRLFGLEVTRWRRRVGLR